MFLYYTKQKYVSYHSVVSHYPIVSIMLCGDHRLLLPPSFGKHSSTVLWPLQTPIRANSAAKIESRILEKTSIAMTSCNKTVHLCDQVKLGGIDWSTDKPA